MKIRNGLNEIHNYYKLLHRKVNSPVLLSIKEHPEACPAMGHRGHMPLLKFCLPLLKKALMEGRGADAKTSLSLNRYSAPLPLLCGICS